MRRPETNGLSVVRINLSEPGMVISALSHAALLIATMVTFSGKPDFQITPDTVSVDMITDAELTTLTRGDKTQKDVVPDASIKAAKIAEETKSQPNTADDKKDVPSPEPKPAPEPQPVPKEQAKPPPAPAPPAPTPPATPTPPPPPPQAVAEVPAPPPPPSRPEPKFEPDKIEKLLEKKVPPKKAEPNFNAASIEKLLQSKETPQQSAARSTQTSNASNAGSDTGSAQKLTVALRDQLAGMIRDQLQRCWSPPAWVTGAEQLRPVIRIRLNETGGLLEQPVVISPSSETGMRAMEESALRAVQRCAPIKIPQQFQSFYNDWKDIVITFDVSAML